MSFAVKASTEQTQNNQSCQVHPTPNISICKCGVNLFHSSHLNSPQECLCLLRVSLILICHPPKRLAFFYQKYLLTKIFHKKILGEVFECRLLCRCSRFTEKMYKKAGPCLNGHISHKNGPKVPHPSKHQLKCPKKLLQEITPFLSWF